MPLGGDGYYFIATHYSVDGNEYAVIDLRVNGITIATMNEDNLGTIIAPGNGGYSAVVLLSEGMKHDFFI